jgi:hypothetical protein
VLKVVGENLAWKMLKWNEFVSNQIRFRSATLP